jgi:hypothetical protein
MIYSINPIFQTNTRRYGATDYFQRGPGSECLCSARAVVSFKSAIVGTVAPLASTYRAGMGTLRVVMGTMRVFLFDSGPNAVMGTLPCTLRAVVGIKRAVVGRIRAVASPSRAVIANIRFVMGSLRAFVSSPSAVMGTLHAVVGTSRSVTSSASALLGTIHMGHMFAVVSTSRAVRREAPLWAPSCVRRACRREHSAFGGPLQDATVPFGLGPDDGSRSCTRARCRACRPCATLAGPCATLAARCLTRRPRGS